MIPAEQLRENLELVRSEIARAALRSGRDPSAITLVAVTKRRSLDLVRDLSTLGVRDFGENYPQELWEKVAALSDLDARWHSIGHLQGNKVARTVPLVRMIHGVDSSKLLRAIDALNLADSPEVCLQVNCSGEASKYGWSADGLLADADLIASCKNVPIVGLMTIAALGTDGESARSTFVQARELRNQLRDRTGLPLLHLSMGMSGDYAAAIEEGATLVRIGSALFEGLDS